MPELDWIGIGISWILSTITTIVILFIAICLHKRCGCKSTNMPEVHKRPVADDKDITYIPNPFSKSAYLEWTATKPLETSSPKMQKNHKQMMPLISDIEKELQGNEYYEEPKRERIQSKRSKDNHREKVRHEKTKEEKRYDLIVNNATRNTAAPLKFNKVVENGMRSKKMESEMIVDLNKSPAEKRRQNRQRNRLASNRSTKSDSQEGMQINITKETNLSNSQKNSDRQLFFVKCEGINCSKTNCHQTERSEKSRRHDGQMDEARITQLPPRPVRQSNSLLFLKDSPKTKTAVERCHSSSPPATPTRATNRKHPSNQKHPKMQLKVDELCYISLPSFTYPINT